MVSLERMIVGSRGPKPVPTNVHVLRGNPSKLPLSTLLSGDGTVRPETEIPDAPEWLSDEARAEWDRITPHLQKLGLVSSLDRAVLTAYCVAWSDFVWAEGRIIELGGDAGRIIKTHSGYQQVSALWTIKGNALDRLSRFAADFGLSPSARSRVTSGEPVSGAQGELPGMEKPKEGGWGDF